MRCHKDLLSKWAVSNYRLSMVGCYKTSGRPVPLWQQTAVVIARELPLSSAGHRFLPHIPDRLVMLTFGSGVH